MQHFKRKVQDLASAHLKVGSLLTINPMISIKPMCLCERVRIKTAPARACVWVRACMRVWEGAIPVRELPANDCVLYDNWSLQQHSCPSVCQPGLALILYVTVRGRKKKKKQKYTSFMGPLEHSDEVGAKLAFHISTRNQKEARLPHNN